MTVFLEPQSSVTPPLAVPPEVDSTVSLQSKWAFARLFLSRYTLADGEVPEASPVQRSNLSPFVTVAEMSCVEPQSSVRLLAVVPRIPAVPPEVDVTVSVNCFFLKVAVTVRSRSIVTVGPSDQLESSQQALGAALAVAGSPSA